MVATFDHDVLRDDTPFPFAVQTEQHKLVHMGLDALRSLGCAIHFGTRVTSCVQNADRVTLDIETNGERATVEADWVIAADGGRSTMRKNLGIEFEGYTWPERFIVLTVLDDMQKHMQCCYRNYLAGEGEWGQHLQGRGRRRARALARRVPNAAGRNRRGGVVGCCCRVAA